ncbi:MAG: hypothetical protein WC239_02495 [Sphaerochaetaceae bacterium]
MRLKLVGTLLGLLPGQLPWSIAQVLSQRFLATGFHGRPGYFVGGFHQADRGRAPRHGDLSRLICRPRFYPVCPGRNWHIPACLCPFT